MSSRPVTMRDLRRILRTLVKTMRYYKCHRAMRHVITAVIEEHMYDHKRARR